MPSTDCHLKTLAVLNLRENEITASGVQYLVDALKVNQVSQAVC